MSNLVPPTFAGSSLFANAIGGSQERPDTLVIHDIGDDKSEAEMLQRNIDHDFAQSNIRAQLDAAFDQAISEIDSVGTNTSDSPERLRFGDISGILSAQPLAAELRETLGGVTAAASQALQTVSSKMPEKSHRCPFDCSSRRPSRSELEH